MENEIEDVEAEAPAADDTRAAVTPKGWEPGTTERRFVQARSTVPQSYNAEERTIEGVFATPYRVKRWFGWEELAVTDAAINLDRVTLGQVRVLDHHNAYERGAVLGVVLDARVEDGVLKGTIRFADNDAGRAAEADAASGDLTGISIGYRVNKLVLAEDNDDGEVYRADAWELLEVSIVSVPADPLAGLRSADAPKTRNVTGRAGPQTQEFPMEDETIETNVAGDPAADDNKRTVEEKTPAPAPAEPEKRTATKDDVTAKVASAMAEESKRRSEITVIARQAKIEGEPLETALNEGMSVDAFRELAFKKLADEAEARPTSNSRAQSIEFPRGGLDAEATRRTAMTEVISAKLAIAGGERGVEMSDAAREYVDYGLAEIAADCIDYRGKLRTSREIVDVFERAFHTVSDFPAIFGDAMNQRLTSRYNQVAPTYRLFAARMTASDFRKMNVIRAGDFPALQPVNEAGEIKSGTFGESKEEFQVSPFGVSFRITRQMLVNDQLSAIDQVLGASGDRVSDFENGKVYGALLSGTGAGPVLKTDGKRVFHADHGNLAGSGTTIDVANVGAARAAIMKQKTIDGLKANFIPSILLCGPDMITTAEQLFAAIVPPEQAKAVPASMRRLTPVVDSAIEDNAWYLFADPASAPCFVYGYLEGFEGPRLSSENEFDTQGMKVKLEHDFGFGAIDYRGAYRNPGQ